MKAGIGAPVNKDRAFRFAPYIIVGLILTVSPPFMGLPVLGLATKILIFSLLVMSLDLVVGYSGLWCFCQAALFGIAAYTTAILTKRYDIASFWVSAPVSLLMVIIFGAVIGFISLRVSKVYFLLITFGLGQLIYSGAIRWKGLTGGTYGLTGIPYPNPGFSLSSSIDMYYFALIIVLICFFLLYMITRSPFGITIQGIRENEVRMSSLGYNTRLYKLLAFVVGSLFAGVAGILYVYYNGLITPVDIDVVASGFLWLMLIIGGTGTLWGALVGTTVILSLQYWISIITPERWPMIIGALFIASVLFLRGGIFPYLARSWNKVKQHYVKG